MRIASVFLMTLLIAWGQDSRVDRASKLRQAVWLDDTTAVKAALAAGASVSDMIDDKQFGRRPALHVAMTRGKLDAAAALIEAGAVLEEEDVAMLNKMVRSSLWYRRPDMANFALEHGADPTLVGPDGRTLLHQVMGKATPKIVRQLLESGGKRAVNIKDGEDRTAFTEACRYRKFAEARLLLDAGANPALGDVVTSTYHCLRGGQEDLALRIMSAPDFAISATEATRLLPTTAYMAGFMPKAAARLLELGADPNLRDRSTRISRAVDPLALEIAKSGDGRFIHDLWREAGEAKLAEAFVAKVTGINARGEDGSTLLGRAIRADQYEKAVNLMQDQGAWLEIPDGNELRTPLAWAVAGGSLPMTSLLLQAGASIDAVDGSGDSLLHLAVGHRELVRELLTAGADPEARDAGGKTARERILDSAAAPAMQEYLQAATGVMWTEDYEAAVENAKKNGEMILLMFTGSDWCGYCTMLEREVFYKPGFNGLAGGRMQLVKLDYPRNRKKQDPEIAKRNAKLKERYKQGRNLGFPTVVITTPDGEEVARRSGYLPGSRAAWLQWFRNVSR